MKKAAAFLVAATLLCTFAFTVRGRVDFHHNPYPCTNPEEGDPDHSNAYGWVQISEPDPGDPDPTVQVQIRVFDGAPDYEYWVVLMNPYYELGTLWTNRVGHGNFHIALPASDLEGRRIGIWESPLNGPYGCFVLRTPILSVF